MDKKSKYLTWAFVVVVLLAILWGYKTFILDRDFIIHSYSDCNPAEQPCFIWCEDGECDEDYYSKIVKNASNIDICNEAIEECEPLTCEPGEIDCQIIYCTDSELDEGEICTNPANFVSRQLEAEATSTDTEI